MSCCSHHHHADKPHGACEWLAERLSAIALIPVGLWAIWSAIHLAGASHAEFTAWLSVPFNAGMMAALVVLGFWHGTMGCQIIAEDYIATMWFRRMKIIGMKVFFTALAVLSLLAIHHIAF